MRITAGQQLTGLMLRPGEEIRTPLIALLSWKGEDVVRAQNLWRRWFLAHNTPRVNGRIQPPIAQIQVDGSEANIAGVKGFLEAGIVTAIDPVGKESLGDMTYRATVSLDEADTRFMWLMTASVSITTTSE